MQTIVMNMQSLLYTGLFVQGITIGRLASIIAGLVGLTGVIIGRQALVRTTRSIGTGRTKAIAALVMGLTGIAASGLHLAITTGGFGTGSGRAGAIVALVIGGIGAAFGWMALNRSRQTISSDDQ
jgi:hypothetical protein